ncbi:MAG TPA: carboxypeptidase regulatory-like domain-containing protein, partial [Vicinamibacteria bacterium]|nr:carboxypeptidase regulatory-like domain-containing protein [Vicinamibacteria bacterium]
MKAHRALLVLAAPLGLGVLAAVPTAQATGPVTVSGTVRDLLDRPVPGAVVAVVGADRAKRTWSDARGHFVVETAPGDYAVTATAPWNAAGSVFPVTVVGDAVVDVRLGDSGSTLAGRVTDEAGIPVAAVLRFVRGEAGPAGVFYAESDATGHYRVVLPAAVRYLVEVDSPDYIAQRVSVEGAPARVLDVVVARAMAAPEEAVAWIRRQAHPLTTVEPGRSLADLEPLRAVVGEARVVGLGEATHGTREFFQLKHRLLEFLVERMGFTVLA